jgi:hypothetical protein
LLRKRMMEALPNQRLFAIDDHSVVASAILETLSSSYNIWLNSLIARTKSKTWTSWKQLLRGGNVSEGGGKEEGRKRKGRKRKGKKDEHPLLPLAPLAADVDNAVRGAVDVESDFNDPGALCVRRRGRKAKSARKRREREKGR